MNALNDDPRLTAFALGELSGKARRELEAELRQSPGSLEEVDAIQKLGSLLEEQLSAEPCPELDDVTRARIEAKAKATSDVPAWAEPVTTTKTRPGAAAPVVPWYRKAPKTAWTAAACVLFAGGLALLTATNKGFRVDEAIMGEASMAKRAPVAGDRADDGAKMAQEEAERRYAARTPAMRAPAQDPRTVPTGPRVDVDHVDRPDRVPSGPLENPFVAAASQPVSTFSSDVDTASYTRIRRLIKQGMMPRPQDVRLEELINYFRYDYPAPAPNSTTPFTVHTEVAQCPWKPDHQLLKVGIKGREIDFAQRPSSNLVFLLDVSGSMHAADKLPLLKQSLRLMLTRLGENDRVAIVVYAGASGLVLPSTPASESGKILAALDRLQARGSTNGGAGIQLAYRVAAENFIPGGINRVLLATDGDFNVGVSSQRALIELIQQKAKSKIFLSVLGFGMSRGDQRLEAISNKGNGTYAFIDSLAEAKKVLVKELGGTLVTIAKDVKFQLQFEPTQVSSYRLIGYENRVLANRDFNDDTKDAGEIGAGHTVTAFYEVVPRSAGRAGALATVRVRYKQPEGTQSTLLEHGVNLSSTRYDDASTDFRFASAVAGFGLLLKQSRYKGQANWALIEELARGSLGTDREGYRKELLELVQTARARGR